MQVQVPCDVLWAAATVQLGSLQLLYTDSARSRTAPTSKRQKVTFRYAAHFHLYTFCPAYTAGLVLWCFGALVQSTGTFCNRPKTGRMPSNMPDDYTNKAVYERQIVYLPEEVKTCSKRAVLLEQV